MLLRMRLKSHFYGFWSIYTKKTERREEAKERKLFSSVCVVFFGGKEQFAVYFVCPKP